MSRESDRLNNPCERCGKHAAIGSDVHFASNFGIGFQRFERHSSGNFCPACIHKKMVVFTLVNLVGWLGMISAIKVCQFLLSNAAEYEHAVSVMLRRRRERKARVAQLNEKASKAD